MATSIKTLIKFHREWLDNNGDRILSRDSEYLDEDIKAGTSAAFLQIPDSLDGLATYYGISGTVQLIDGDQSGWKHISTAIDFRGWALKIRAESFFRKVSNFMNLTNHVGRAACLVCVSEKWGGMAESILREVDRDQGSIYQPYWKSRRFEPFVLDCCLLRAGQEPAPHQLEQPYLAILQNWDDDSALVDALEQVCDYHCANIDDLGGDWDPEFKYSPFDFLPCEVMLVRQIRKELGLTVPEVAHKLISLLSPPDTIGGLGEEHEMIKKLSRAYDQYIA